MRRTIARYLIVALIQTLRMTSVQVAAPLSILIYHFVALIQTLRMTSVQVAAPLSILIC
jgi:uncharacterized membrane protein AbrB (regulator of aidB expression)